MEESIKHNLFKLIKMSLWPDKYSNGGMICDEDIYREMKDHALVALPGGILSLLSMSADLRKAWKLAIYGQLYLTSNYICEEKALPLTVPFAILKGSSAAQYYPHPEYRTMGDIDIITQREDYETACLELLKNGYSENTVIHAGEKARHRSFIRTDITVEVHESFALLNEAEDADYMDRVIRSGINPTHRLPDLVNGLVLIEHISEHMENGLGLRQIIDWMMFVHTCLSDESWKEFKPLAERIGLERLAIVTTRMCEIYLGLPEKQWAANADPQLCTQLMDYILSCGNFGKKLNREDFTSVKVLSVARSPKAFFRFLGDFGARRWELAQKYSILRPLGALRLLGYYVKKGFGRKTPWIKLMDSYFEAQRKMDMLEKLNVRLYKKEKENHP